MHKKSLAVMTPSVDRDYQREDDHRTLIRAAEIIGNRARLNGTKRHHRQQRKAMSLVQRTMLQR